MTTSICSAFPLNRQSSGAIRQNPGYRKLVLLILALAFVLAGCNPQEPQPSFHATDITGAGFARSFNLTDHLGNKRTLADFKGKVVVLFFGYVHCPDICPTTLSELAAVMNKLGPDAGKVQVLFVTLDPERDTQAVLARFVPAFNPAFLGLYGSPEQISETMKEYKLVVQKQAGKRKEDYTLDHSAGTYIYDRQGRLRLYASYDQGVDALAEDIGALLR